MANHPLSNNETARIIGIDPKTLKFWRHIGKGPRFCKLGEAKQSGVVYYEADVLAWIEERKFANTSAYSPNAKPAISSPPDVKA